MARDPKQAKRRTTRAVYLWDRLASGAITFGGVGILAAVLGICVYLLWTVLPLFRSGSAEPRAAAQLPVGSQPIGVVVGEYAQAIATIDLSGTVQAFSLATGAPFHSAKVTDARTITAAALTSHGPAAIALDDGSLLLGALTFESTVLHAVTAPHLQALEVGAALPIPADGESPPSLIERTRDDQWRSTTLKLALTESQPGGQGVPPIRRLDLRDDGSGGRFLVLIREDGSAQFGSIETITPLSGEDPTETVSGIDFTLATPSRGVPDWSFVTADGRHIYALWKDGTLERYAPSGDAVRLAETTSVVPYISSISARPQVTAAAMLLGGLTLLVGDTAGEVRAYHPARDPTSPAVDAMRFVQSDDATPWTASSAAIESIAPSRHDRIIAVVNHKGQGYIRHMTSHKTLATFNSAGETSLVFSPKGDTLLATSAAAYRLWNITPGHADASLSSLFGPVLYEGELKPEFIYQSSAAGEGAQVKMSLVPLIFGTLKATIVAMLIAVPLAVLGAIYTSEFMHKDLRKVIKPTVELMASLPSVVLGFIAAMVVAPYMARHLPGILVAIILTPVFLGLFAHIWQLVPRQTAHRISRRARFLLISAALAASIALGAVLARPVEHALFAPNRTDILLASGSYATIPREQWPAWVGQRQTMSPNEERRLRQDGLAFRRGNVVKVLESGPNTNLDRKTAGPPGIQRWLDGAIGGPYPGWLLALLIPSLVAVYFAQARLIDRERFERVLGASPLAMSLAELFRYALVALAGFALAAALAALLTALGLDARDSIFGPFSQRNTLVVGVIMGFAVIPIIYTISEDALRSVPNHLRSASLGVGATPWQTAVRVVLPTAASGVFSAIMIGLGRAVGETMIVLMATGNTPEISANIFSGLRTLAANIAVELPEAVRGGTHYRVLFLCGLVLFIMTFAVNTTAEIVRQRFRKRNAAL